MAKHQRKVRIAQAARVAAFTGKGPSQNNNQKAHLPGSQNRKKSGFGSRSSNR